MDVDILKTSGSHDIDTNSMAMMMQMEKFPTDQLLCEEPFYNTTTLTYPQNEFSGGIISSTTTLPIFSNVNPNVAPPTSSNFVNNPSSILEKNNSMAAMREMIFRVAVMQPIHIDPESVKPPKRRNMKISKDPQSVAARHRRERISEKIRILQRLVPGGTKMDTASMLDEAIHYVKFLKKQVQTLEQARTYRVLSNANVINYSAFNCEGLPTLLNAGWVDGF